MATKTTYVDLQGGSDSVTWAQCQNSGTPALTLDKIVQLAKVGTNTSPGDLVVVNVKSTEVRTAQSVQPDWDVSGVSFTFQPWGCESNAGGRWFCKGPDATRIALIQESAITGSGDLPVAFSVKGLDFLHGTNTSRVYHRDASTTCPITLDFQGCNVNTSAKSGCGLVAGTGGAAFALRWSSTTFNLNSQFLSAGVTATSVEDGGLGDTSSITQVSGSIMEFSATRKLAKYSVQGTQMVTGDITTHHAIDLTNNVATEVTHRNSKVWATQGTAASLFLLPDTGNVDCPLTILGNDFAFTGTGSGGACVAVGRSDNGLGGRAAIYALMNHKFVGPDISFNSFRNPHNTGPGLVVDVGVDAPRIWGNVVMGGAGAHTFRLSCNRGSVRYNLSVGGLPLIVFGNANKVKNNLAIVPAVSSAPCCLIGSPGGFDWEKTGYWGVAEDDGGQITDNAFLNMSGSPAFTDYSGASPYKVLTVVDRNYYWSGGADPLWVTGASRATLAAAQAAWGISPQTLASNDSHSKFTTPLVGSQNWLLDLLRKVTGLAGVGGILGA